MKQSTHLKQPAHNDDYQQGLVAFDSKHYEEALKYFDQAVAHDPHFKEAYFYRAGVLKTLHRYNEALQDYDRFLALDPSQASAHSNRGNVLKSLERYEEALQSYDKAIGIDPLYANAYSNRGITLHEVKRYEEALQSYDHAIAINPQHAEAYFNRASALKMLYRYEEALHNYDQAIALAPRYATAYSNRGNLLKALRRYDEAFQSYDQAMAISPNHAGAHRNKALLSLLLGDLPQGFALYEWRWLKNDGSTFKRPFTEPLWLGNEDLRGKSILLYSEQGLGDTLHFCRYIDLVARLGATIILETMPPLYTLFQQFTQVSCVVLAGQPLPAFDYQCPLLSLPLAFKTTLETIPHHTPYLRADAQNIQDWKDKLRALPHPRIGLVGSGSTWHNNDQNRSIPLATLMRYLPSQFEYVLLQKELRATDQSTVETHKNLHFFGDVLNDFSDTAGLCACMDFIVSVDTSVAHLACAMDQATAILLPYTPDWRWLDHGDTSPWYPSAHLFRQNAVNDWDECLRSLNAFLEKRFAH